MERNSDFLRINYIRALYPVMFSVLGGTINTLIDSIMVSKKLGGAALAAVNLSVPIYLAICTLGLLIAGGASIISSWDLGDGKIDKSFKHYYDGVNLTIIVGIVITLAGIALCRPISYFLANGGALTDMVYIYSLVTFIGVIPSALLYFPLYYLQIAGRERGITISMGILIAVDVILDILFIYVLEFGLAGAAAASVLATVAGTVYGFYGMYRADSRYGLRFSLPSGSNISYILMAGLPACLGSLCDALKLLFVNGIVLLAGGEGGLVVWAVLNSVAEVSRSITSGVPQTAAPLTGLYYTSKENSALRILMGLQFRTGSLYIAIFSALLILCHRLVEAAFAIDTNLRIPLAFLCLYVFFELLCAMWVSYYNSTSHLVISGSLNVFKSLLFPVLAAFVVMKSGIYLWLFLPLGGLLSLAAMSVMSEIVVQKAAKAGKKISRLFLLDDHLEKEGKILDFSVLPTAEHISDASEKIKDFCLTNDMDAKQTNKLGLAIEEVLQIFADKMPGIQSVDLRAFSLPGSIGMRLRIEGQEYDPFKEADENEDDLDLLGIVMLNNMAEAVTHNYVMGMNVFNIIF